MINNSFRKEVSAQIQVTAMFFSASGSAPVLY